ncbi:MAG: hypothetical protein MZV63_41025 [Marinilabiliales bacterium]|nr:hypothetical protein [Marinilabiliales bacterium]
MANKEDAVLMLGPRPSLGRRQTISSTGTSQRLPLRRLPEWSGQDLQGEVNG